MAPQSNYIDSVASKIRAEVGESSVPSGDAEPLFRTYAVLALAKGSNVNCEDVHNAWVAWVSAANPGHESAVPYSELDRRTREQDEPFVAAIRRVAARL
jgi:hypothetical protein